MPKKPLALLVITVAPLLLKLLTLPPSLLNAHAPKTPTEMVPNALTVQITLRQLVVALVIVSLHKLLACVRPTSTAMPELAHAQFALMARALLPKRALGLHLRTAYALKTPMEP
jgi:hypothetical protein